MTTPGTTLNAFTLPVARSPQCHDECSMFGTHTESTPHPYGPGSCRESCRFLRGEPPQPPKVLVNLILAAVTTGAADALTEALAAKARAEAREPDPAQVALDARWRGLLAELESLFPAPRWHFYNLAWYPGTRNTTPVAVLSLHRQWASASSEVHKRWIHDPITFPITAFAATPFDALAALADKVDGVLAPHHAAARTKDSANTETNR